jgi:hypothetical protein
MNTWQYRVVPGYNDTSWMDDELNAFGANGWELVGTSPILVQDAGGMNPRTSRTDWFLIFKRQTDG